MADERPPDLASTAGERPLERGPQPASAQMFTASERTEQPGDQIGPYRLLEVIGEGGFGVVYLAERREPMVQRVALKIIKPGMDSKAVVARFEQERQALAVMDHPNVARVLDGGVTPMTSAGGGRPYFVMELVKGDPITAFADRHRLTIKQRLELFIPVCEAVQHAHMKGIIHRDIKPSNVLVVPGGEGHTPTVKVIDFGVAKAISHTLTDKTIFTEQGQIIGTPEYMSPEQAEMGATDIDTRTDVYSLGVVLYELLSGTLPFDAKSLRAAGYAEIQRIIREVDAPRPSTKLSTADDQTGAAIAKARQADRERIAGELRRELEWIPLKALRKDRTRRYASAESLGADVRRYLDGKPLEAAPESRAYLLRKFVRRNRVHVAAVTAVAVALVAGFGTALWQAREAARQRDVAEARRAESERIVNYLRSPLETLTDAAWDSDLLSDLEDRAQRMVGTRGTEDLSEAEESAVTMAAVAISQFEALKAARDAEKERADQLKKVADFQSQMLAQIDTTKAGLDLIADLRERHALALRAAGLPATEHAARVDALTVELARVNATDTAVAMIDRTILKPAIKTIDEQFQNDPKTDASLREALADWYLRMGLYQAALRLQGQASSIRKRIQGDDHADTRVSEGKLMSIVLSQLQFHRREFGDAELEDRRALEKSRRDLGEDHPGTLTRISNLAVLLADKGKLSEAEPLCREALERSLRVLGKDHPDALVSIQNMGGVMRAQNRLDEAEPYLREALENSRRILGDEHPITLRAVSQMASLRLNQAKPSEAIDTIARFEAAARKVFTGDLSPGLAGLLVTLGRARTALGSSDEPESYTVAESNLVEAHEIYLAATVTIAPHSKLRCIQALIDLYTAWHKAEPGKGYDAKAAEWQAKLDAAKTDAAAPSPGKSASPPAPTP